MHEKARRVFLKTCTQVALLSALMQINLHADEPYHDSRCGEHDAKRFLVTYASAYGSTKEMAERIGKSLCEEGNSVDIKWVNHVEDVRDYDMVIVGGAIQYDTWLEEAQAFVKHHEESLSKIPLAYFFTCLTLASKSSKAQDQAEGYAQNIQSLTSLKPLDIQGFAGVLDYSKMSFVFRQVARAIFAVMGVKEGDYRDWKAVGLWSQKIQTLVSKS